MTAALIDIRAVAKRHVSGSVETPVLFGVDLKVERDDFIAVMGQSGSGKSTLMNILGCLDQATGRPLPAGRRRNALPHAGTAGRHPQPHHRLCVPEFQPDRAHERAGERGPAPDLCGRALAKALVELERVGLAGLGKRTPNQLSGGQQQRVAIARALVGDAPLILADEPTGNLDTHISDDIVRGLQKLDPERGITIVPVTHEPDIAAWSRRLVRLKDGRVMYDGPAAEGLRQLASSHEQAALGSPA